MDYSTEIVDTLLYEELNRWVVLVVMVPEPEESGNNTSEWAENIHRVRQKVLKVVPWA
jgi:CRISPR/Cas system-associated exonuclease Cas4 (RecB family)